MSDAMLRFKGGARGLLWASQVATGHANGLRLRVYGEKAGLSWVQQEPNHIEFMPLGEPPRRWRAAPRTRCRRRCARPGCRTAAPRASTRVRHDLQRRCRADPRPCGGASARSGGDVAADGAGRAGRHAFRPGPGQFQPAQRRLGEARKLGQGLQWSANPLRRARARAVGCGSGWWAAGRGHSSAACTAWRPASTVATSWWPAASSGTAEKSKASAAELGVALDRAYGSFEEMAAARERAPDAIEAVGSSRRTTCTFGRPRRSSTPAST